METIKEMKQQTYLKRTNTDHYTMFINDVFSIHGECIVIGVIDGGPLSKKDKVWILGPYGNTNAAEIADIQEIQEIENVRKVATIIQSGTKGMKVGIWLRKIRVDEVKPGFVLASLCPNVQHLEAPIENPFLKGLLRGKDERMKNRLENYIWEEIKSHARFLVAVTTKEREQEELASYRYLTNEENMSLQPVFTDWAEFNTWYEQGEECPRAAIMSLKEIYEIVKENEVLDGIVVNAFSDSFCLNKKTIARWVKEKK